jgi:hypothetical protein
MIFNGIMKTEALFFHLENNKDEVHFIEMERDCEEDVFYVRVCCDDKWEWKFYDEASNYELVKHAIFDAGFDAENMNDLLWELDAIFEEYFEEIVIWDECDGNCGCCNCK